MLAQHIKLSDGRIRATWSTASSADSRILMDGPESFFYADGKPQWTVVFRAGRKIEKETLLRENGQPMWIKTYGEDQTWTWENFDANGDRIATSHWRGKTLLNSDVPDGPVDKTPGADKLPTPEGL